ncbi:tetratricopeptide (TPR) repeat protein [Streptomyces sp. V4I8]|uniref:CHAT domain-containing protein n=1 Tax=Streptomyces sp. V4I8 TaxID=3156469 RepID=UPI00351897C2
MPLSETLARLYRYRHLTDLRKARRFNRAQKRLRRGLDAYERTRVDHFVLDDEALADALELWNVIRPADPRHFTRRDREWIAAAHLAIGWFFHARWAARPTNFELSQAIYHLAPIAHHPGVIPEALVSVLGAAAEPEVQAAVATSMLTEASSTTERSYLTAVIELFRQALLATPPDDPLFAAHANNLGIAYRYDHQWYGAEEHLERAILLTEQALELMPAAGDERADVLSNLTACYQQRHLRTGALADLDKAVELGSSATDVAVDPSHRALALSHLGIAHQLRYMRNGATADLQWAIEVAEEAVSLTPADHPERAGRLANLAVGLQQRYLRSNVPADLARAIDISEQCVATTPVDHPERGLHLSHLASALSYSYRENEDSAALDRAIDVGEQALALITHVHPDRVGHMSNLAKNYRLRYEQRGTPEDLRHAVDHAEQALSITSDDHPVVMVALANLAHAYRLQVLADGDHLDREVLHGLASLAVNATTASAEHRVLAYAKLGQLARDLREMRLAVELFDAAVALLPSVAPGEIGREDQEHRIGQFYGLVGETVAAHLAIDDATGAVEIGELARGILLAAELDSRTDLTGLEETEPDLAIRFRSARDRLAQAQLPPLGAPVGVGLVDHRRRLWDEYNELLGDIRKIPDFTRFLLPPELTESRTAATGGVVVLVNLGVRRGDAVIITSDGEPTPVPLPDLSWEAATANATQLVWATHDNTLTGRLRGRRLLTDTLAWMRAAIVEPVLDALPPTERIWWLPTGILGLFPLHAAITRDDVVSSYTPTLRALNHARTRRPVVDRRHLTVALAHLPGLPDLPGTAAEAATLHAHHRGTLLVDDTATSERVLAELTTATWAHFACHATAHLTEPSRGGLVLRDGVLPIATVSRLQLEQAELAYLSACSTARRNIEHADESIHLASAFQLAGFRHVIASLWPLDDAVAAMTARIFYDHLSDDDHLSDQPAADRAAYALHRVAWELRRNHPDRPDLWAALVHSGP